MEAIASVQAQTYTNWEIIVVNDGSTEELTNEILSNLNMTGVQVIHTRNQGLPAARNNGIARATGEYVLPLDADDRIAATYVEKAMDEFKRNQEVKLVYCRGRYFGARTDAVPFNGNPFSLKDLLLYNFIFCSAFFRRNDFKAVGGYSVSMKGGWEDWDFWIRLLKDGGNVFQLPEELFFYRAKHSSMIEDVKQNVMLQQRLGEQLFSNNREVYFSVFGSPLEVYRQWQQLKQENDTVEAARQSVYATASYRLGHILLYPLKRLKDFLKK
ncbi:galactosyltransferase-like protein [Algoriphagus boseongensis]|uniref:Galactosyltransferase-like protein n=2 Tax=Algoriphagus boseongensis TaxID=1442587 RepID=A0A4V3D2L1_9BACT|nr:galactosyltransferase-like protein [Algoriphagus boseongensis]